MSKQVHSPPEALRKRGLAQSGAYIYVACPWTHVGGGMFKVADYLIQSQSAEPCIQDAVLRPLDTQGPHAAVYSLWVSMTAIARLVAGRFSGRLRGVHVNMAERLSLVRKSVIVATCRLLGVPVVLHLHAAQLPRFYRRLPFAMRWLIRWVFAQPACVVVLGEVARRFVVDELRVPADRVEVVTNGVPGPTAARRADRLGAGRQRLFFLGSDWERKGLFDLLRALAEPGFSDESVELVVAGRGDIDFAREKARQAGVESRVRFEGWADQARAATLLAQADALVLPAYDEGLPLVILESLANGVAVVCTPVGEIPSVLKDGMDVCFVPPGDIAGIAAGIRKVLGDAAFRARLEANGRLIHQQRFSMDRFFDRIALIHRRHFGVAAAPRKGGLS